MSNITYIITKMKKNKATEHGNTQKNQSFNYDGQLGFSKKLNLRKGLKEMRKYAIRIS